MNVHERYMQVDENKYYIKTLDIAHTSVFLALKCSRSGVIKQGRSTLLLLIDIK